jgi:hypothetical protein
VGAQQIIILDVVVTIEILSDVLQYLFESALQANHLEIWHQILLDVVERRLMAERFLRLGFNNIGAIVEYDHADENLVVVFDPVEPNAA